MVRSMPSDRLQPGAAAVLGAVLVLTAALAGGCGGTTDGGGGGGGGGAGTGSYDGVVIDAATGTPLADADVTVADAVAYIPIRSASFLDDPVQAAQAGGTYTARSDASGAFHFTSLPYGDYLLDVDPPNAGGHLPMRAVPFRSDEARTGLLGSSSRRLPLARHADIAGAQLIVEPDTINTRPGAVCNLHCFLKRGDGTVIDGFRPLWSTSLDVGNLTANDDGSASYAVPTTGAGTLLVGASLGNVMDPNDFLIGVCVCTLNGPPAGSTGDFPRIHAITAVPQAVRPAQACTLAVTTTGPPPGDLTFAYAVSGGVIVGSGPTVTWVAPLTPGTYEVACTVTDAQSRSSTRSIRVFVVNVALQSMIVTTPDGRLIDVIHNGGTEETILDTATEAGGFAPIVTQPTLSQSGEKLAFIDGNGQAVVTAVTTKTVLWQSTGLTVGRIQFSPSSRKIAYSVPDGIYVADTSGNGADRVVDGANLTLDTWSLGGRMTYTDRSNGHALWSTAVDEDNVVATDTKQFGLNCLNGAVSTNGERMIFIEEVFGISVAPVYRVVVSDVSGPNDTRVVLSNTEGLVDESTYPVWSPYGNGVAYPVGGRIIVRGPDGADPQGVGPANSSFGWAIGYDYQSPN
jgi:hypothetical protein